MAPGPGGRAELPPELLAGLGLGQDPGLEGYKSGTRTRTELELAGGRVQVEITVHPTAEGRGTAVAYFTRGACQAASPIEGEGTDFNLVSVLSSRDASSLAVIVKRTQDGVRRFGFAFARLGDGALAGPRCLWSDCLTALAKLKGDYAQIEQGARTGWGLNVSETEGVLTVSIFGPGEVGGTTYQVSSCSLSGDELTLGLDGREQYVLTLQRERLVSMVCSGPQDCWVMKEPWSFKKL